MKLITKNITINATKGTETFVKNKDIFTGYFDSDFKNYGTDVKSKPTKKTKAQYFEQEKNGTFKKIYESFGVSLDSLCLTQSQILDYVKNNEIGYESNFFLFKVKNEYFVAGVGRRDGGLEACVFRFVSDGVWSAEDRRRWVIPQLNLRTSEKTLSSLDSLTLGTLESAPFSETGYFPRIEKKLDLIIKHFKIK